ncbi:tetratricopeptide repeat protein [Afifella marina]|uniref:TPR repeat n=1 Tax=Afifella marina DSM 2698 TaxID=1120955 RepID=A0A1G5PAS6_AFIMA|nr:tetratricopeptide repeat protein [Afifella marina]MBK1624381.1 sel1 repeat family protein [Afifella marina DSM 2698]MBK1628113.1 sel1 repeat family protein [Afifella marina]MBK5916547.1 hypothetical protein [Afifella marina]RAI18916.1 hypothetical protein CH311_13670 [Afifella marina DSM 2698]SCZ46171.1 hypothetical protein SAMN03080610_03582 [Afifella marina DSM 2698]
MKPLSAPAFVVAATLLSTGLASSAFAQSGTPLTPPDAMGGQAPGHPKATLPSPIPPKAPGTATVDGLGAQIPSEEIDSRQLENRIDQSLKDAGLVPDSNVDRAYGAFQRGHFLTAFAIALQQAEAGRTAAQTLLGELLSRGLGVKTDYKEAAGWYELAAKAGDREALYALGRLYLDGRGVDQDDAKAAEYFQRAADLGQPVAERELAYLLLQGKGVEKNPMLAAAHLRNAARAGDSDAQYALAGLYREGVGVVGNPAEAARWYATAARNGHIPSQIEYAIMLFNGEGLRKDEKTAAQWFRQAALADNPVGELRYAKLLKDGLGVEKDEVEAARWYLIARSHGLKEPFMEGWLMGLPSGIRKEADARVAAWPGVPTPQPASATTGTDAAHRQGPSQRPAAQRKMEPDAAATGSPSGSDGPEAKQPDRLPSGSPQKVTQPSEETGAAVDKPGE